jgi:DMSO/TMAO reductase YedYZ molybdopterin-dependent catalytic subunit
MSETNGMKRIVSPTVTHPKRIPPGQVITQKFPVYDIGPRAVFNKEKWRFVISGEVKEERMLTWDEFMSLPKVEVVADFHCVTKWSKQNMLWEGVSTRTIYELVEPNPDAKYLMIHCMEGYTTNVPLEDFLKEDSLFAYNLNGKPLEPEHGFPLRLVIPQLYAWKSAKYVNGIEFMLEDEPGFWELRGYHMYGDPWREQRFWENDMKVWEIRKRGKEKL